MGKRIFNTVIATMMALTLILGSTMTVCAKEIVKEGETEDALTPPAEMDVTISYNKGDGTIPDDPTNPDDGDDTGKNIINIVIAYDNLDFSYEAAAIDWNTTDLVYNIKTKDKGGTSRDITVTNKSNTAVTMTPSLVDPASKLPDLKYEVSLKRGEATLWTSSNNKAATGSGSKKLEWGKDANTAGTNKDTLTVSVPNIEVTSETIEKSIDKRVVAKVSLAFANAGKN